MSVRIQIVMGETDAAHFKSQAVKEGKSLSAWLREAGRTTLKQRRSDRDLKHPEILEDFFKECAIREKGVEVDWPALKQMIEEGARPPGIR